MIHESKVGERPLARDSKDRGGVELEPEIRVGSDTPEGLPSRVERYGIAHARAVEMAGYLDDRAGEMCDRGYSWGAWHFDALAKKLRACGDVLVFRLYPALAKVRLHAARFCQVHQLCPFCAIRRGAKLLRLYLARFEVLQAKLPVARAWFVTLTVKDGEELEERFAHLQASWKILQARRHEKARKAAGSVMRGVLGGVGSYEFKRGSGSGLWHPHFHCVMLAENEIDQAALSAEWKEITGDSFIVDVRELYGETALAGFLECFKYAVKFSDMPLDENYEAYQLLKGERLVTSFGEFRGIDVSCLDDDQVAEDEPYIELLYRYKHGVGYSFEGSTVLQGQLPSCEGPEVSRKIVRA